MKQGYLVRPFAVILALWTLQLAAVSGLAAQDGRPLTAADLVDVRELDEVSVSPDGAWVAAVIREIPDTTDGETARGERVLVLVPSEGGEAPTRVAPEVSGVSGVAWGPEGTLAFMGRGEDGVQIFLYSPTAPMGGARAVRMEETPSRFAWSPTGQELAFLARVESTEEGSEARSTGVWLLDLASGGTRPLTPAGVAVRDMAWSPAGEALALIASDEESDGPEIRVVDRQGGLRTIAEGAGGPGTRRQVLDWSPDGRTVLFSRDPPDGQVGQLLAAAPVDGGRVRILVPEYQGSVMHAVWDPAGRGIIAQSVDGLLSRLIRIDPASDAITHLADIRDAYPSFSVSADGTTFAYRSDRTTAPADVWVLREGEEARRVTNLNPHFDELELGAVEPFTWTNPEDGVEIQGVLVFPPDYEPDRRYPTIVQLHGGPHFHWGLHWLGSWHDWGQLLASRGYVVFHPNPRGSTGRGIPFASAIIHDIGGIDYRDVMAGVDALVAAGIADEDRLGVGGWSYGGFLTARTITQTDRFRAAVVGAGISNLFSFAGTPGLGRGWAGSFFPDHPYADRALFEDRSATTHLANVRSPTLVVHGDADTKISVTQAWELHNGLRYLDIDTEIVIYEAGHTIGARADRIDYLERVGDWFDRYLMEGADGIRQ